MNPEELFKIEDTEIPENKEENITSSEEKTVENSKIDIFSQDLKIEDLIEFLKKNNISTNEKTIEKYYKEITTNNKEKEVIVENIKQLDSQREILIQQIQTEPDNKILLKKITDLEDKISDLNTEERIKEDNVKIILRDMPKIIEEKIQLTETPQMTPEKIQLTETPQMTPEEIKSSETPQITPEKIQLTETPQMTPEEIKSSETPQITPEEIGVDQSSKTASINPPTSEIKETVISEKINLTENIKKEDEEIKKINPIEQINNNPNEEKNEIFASVEKNEALEEIKKNNKMLDDISKNINSGFEFMLKAISENTKNVGNDEDNRQVNDVEPSHKENPKISQPAYLAEYRKSLRKYSGIEPFIGYETQFKGDNIASYI